MCELLITCLASSLQAFLICIASLKVILILQMKKMNLNAKPKIYWIVPQYLHEHGPMALISIMIWRKKNLIFLAMVDPLNTLGLSSDGFSEVSKAALYNLSWDDF